MAVSLPGGLSPPALLRELADGGSRGVLELMRTLQVGAEEFRAGLATLRSLGVEVEESGAVLRLPRPVELLEARRIRAALSARSERLLDTLEVRFEVDSTNTRLLELPPPPAGRAAACTSELQHAGRGRCGRRWIAPFGGSVALSVAVGFQAPAGAALSLAAGVATCRALERLGARGIGLKWPNDVWWEGRKLGGLLLETHAEGACGWRVVVGVGLNLALSGAAREEIERTGVRAAALAEACPAPPGRNHLVGTLLDELLSMLGQFAREGFAPFREPFEQLDVLRGRAVRLIAGAHTRSGTARGVDAQGALLLEAGGVLERVMSGEVSVRMPEGDV